MIIQIGREAYSPTHIFDKVPNRLATKPSMKLDKNVFKISGNKKCPKTTFIVGSIMKFKYMIRKQMEDSRIVYDHDTGNGAPEEEEEEDDTESEDED